MNESVLEQPWQWFKFAFHCISYSTLHLSAYHPCVSFVSALLGRTRLYEEEKRPRYEGNPRLGVLIVVLPQVLELAIGHLKKLGLDLFPDDDLFFQLVHDMI